MRTIILAFAVFLLLGCAAGPDGQPVPVPPISQTSTLSGEGVIGPVQVGIPPAVVYLTAPLKWWGTGTVTVRYPEKPHVIVDGDLGFIIQPLYPQERAKIESDLARGNLLIRVQGRPTGLTR